LAAALQSAAAAIPLTLPPFRQSLFTMPRMRKVVLGLGTSLDGYIARLDGSVDFLFMPKDYSMGPFFATIDTALLGRKTYDVALKMGGGSYYNDSGLKSYVFSHSQPPGARTGVTFVNESQKTFVEKLRKSPGKNIWLMGGGELVRDFLKDDLVDELYIGVVPQREFSLLENKTFSKGMIALRYARTRSKPLKK
jgi:dihydrofolate reductase